MSPHPYRLAMSCLDTPPAPCEPPKKRHLPIEALLLACAFIAAVTGIATLHAVGHGGHVEIAPAAIAHARMAPLATKRKPRQVDRPPAPRPVAQAPFLRGGTHDPKALLAIAKQLQSLGLDVTVSEVELSKPLATSSGAQVWPSFVPVRGRNHQVEVLELHAVPPASQFGAIGLANGDHILAIDGYDIADGVDAIDLVRPRKLGWAIVEIARGVHHVVLSIHWPVP